MTDYQTPGTPAPQNSTMAVISLVAGIICWFMVPVLGAIVAVITGNMAKKEIAESGGTLAGENLAQIGIVSGWIHLAVTLVGVCCFGLFFILPFILAALGMATDSFSFAITPLFF